MALYIGNQKVAPTVMPSSGGVSIPLEVNSKGLLKKQFTPFVWSLPNTAIAVDTNCLHSAFINCTGLTSANLSSLIKINYSDSCNYIFSGCTNLTSVDLSNLSEIKSSNALQYAFQYCSSFKTLSFPSLNSTSFGLYTSQFNSMLQSVTGCTVHFPSNLQSVIGSWTDVTAGFGGTNTTVLFDLPATT